MMSASLRSDQRLASAEDNPSLHDPLSRAAHLVTVGEMLAGIAHEINQPLTAITTLAGALRRTIDAHASDAQQAQEIAEAIAAQAMRAAEVVHKVRSLIGRSAFEFKAISINDAIHGAMTLAEPLAKDRGVSISLDLAAEPPRVLADSVHLQLLLLNLIQNAIEAIEASASAERRILIRTALRPASEIELSVDDTGGGVSADAASGLFRPFNTTKPQGIGLGLLSCQRIARAHGGILTAENIPGSGARFSLRLPVLPGNPEQSQIGGLAP
jgi:C4-dicarboxylate-specific signal transduction histidine kinase